jgi:ferredoxin
MRTITIDNRVTTVPPGTTILQAAEKLGIEIPTLCYWPGKPPLTSCFVCLVKAQSGSGPARYVPACATPVSDGMIVASETAEVYQLRRQAIELLLGHHLGDCVAPCQIACPLHLDVPRMLERIRQEDFVGALRTIRQDMAFAGLLGRVCPRPCQKACRRNQADGAVVICNLKRLMVDWEIVQGMRVCPAPGSPSGKTVVIIGAGLTGLEAAWHLRQRGHRVILYEAGQYPAERFRRCWAETISEETSPRTGQVVAQVLDHEIGIILQSGVTIELGQRIDPEVPAERWLAQADAILLACGADGVAFARSWGLRCSADRVVVDRQSYRTSREAIFAAGSAIAPKAAPLRRVTDGKEAAVAIDSFLSGKGAPGQASEWIFRAGRLSPEDLQAFASRGAALPAEDIPDPLQGGLAAPLEEWIARAAAQAQRCLRCNCTAADSCKLRQLAARYQADPNRYSSLRPAFQQIDRQGDVIYEPGKCIVCGRCLLVAGQTREIPGITLVGRGFDVRVGTPFDQSFSEALGPLADACLAACPTGALYRKQLVQLQVGATDQDG